MSERTPVPNRLLIAAASNNIEAAIQTTKRLKANVYIDEREEFAHLPFRALITVTTDNLEALAPCSDVGLYVICERTIKPGSAGVYGLFPLKHHPDLTHTEADAHWRDNHAPLALEHHPFMTHYMQFSVVHTISGAAIDGFAMCGFANETDMRERFYVSDEGVSTIAADIAKFADLKRSPRRLVARPAGELIK